MLVYFDTCFFMNEDKEEGGGNAQNVTRFWKRVTF